MRRFVRKILFTDASMRVSLISPLSTASITALTASLKLPRFMIISQPALMASTPALQESGAIASADNYRQVPSLEKRHLEYFQRIRSEERGKR